MARLPRAFIIACQNYRNAEDVAQELPGTLDAAAQFYDWFRTSKKVGETEIYLCCDDPVVPAHPKQRTYPGTRVGVLKAIIDLARDGKDQTSELYFFFSGHGVGWEISPQQRGLDVLLASDYVNRQISGASCIKLDELRGDLRKCLGGEDHFYFLDACRTVMKVGEIQPTDLGLALSLATSGEPTTYVLYSTKFGEPAKVNSGFTGALLDGLRGAGRAKQMSEGNWWVRFDRLQKYVQAHVKAKTDLSREGDRDGLILMLPDDQLTRCTVTIDNAQPTDQFSFVWVLSRNTNQNSFTGASFMKDFEPNDAGYRINITSNGVPLTLVEPAEGRPLDMFDPVTLRFTTVVPESVAPRAAPAQAGVNIRPVEHPGIQLRLRNAETGVAAEPVSPPQGQAEWIPLEPGTWIAQTLDGGDVIRSQEVTLGPEERRPIDLLPEPESRVQRGIVARLPKAMGLPNASETLRGPVTHQNTALWLSILGASRLIENPASFSKLGPFPLATFDDLRKDDGAIYVLAGLDQNGPAQISISQSAAPRWRVMEPVPGLDGLCQMRERVAPGQYLVSFAHGAMPPVTYPTYAFPNRAALMVFAVNSSGILDTRQMLLPVYSLASYLDDAVISRFRQESLHLIKYLALAEERYANRRSLAPATSDDQSRWDEMLWGKWIDPLFAIMAIYEAARRGAAGTMATELGQALGNLQRYFGNLPDMAAVSQILAGTPVAPKGAPLLLESLQLQPEWKKSLPLSPDFLDYNSMWTSWFGAVAPPAV